MSETIEDLVFRLASERGVGKTICPTDAARAVAEQRGAPDEWHGKLNGVKDAAVRLAKRGRLAIYRKGKPVDPDDFKGVYRIGLPPAGDALAIDGADGNSDEPETSSD